MFVEISFYFPILKVDSFQTTSRAINFPHCPHALVLMCIKQNSFDGNMRCKTYVSNFLGSHIMDIAFFIPKSIDHGNVEEYYFCGAAHLRCGGWDPGIGWLVSTHAKVCSTEEN